MPAHGTAAREAPRASTPSPRRLFGTDGVRGRAGDLLTPELALALGRGAAAVAGSAAPQILIVRDTRESGHMLEAALAAGVAAAGGDALLGGVLPTPGAALHVRRFGLDMAAVVSASHNPYPDNGIKFFGPDGIKLEDHDERRIEALVEGSTSGRGGSRTASVAPEVSGPASAAPGRVHELHGAGADYLRELELRFRELDLRGRRIILDCANGATFRVAPEIFRRLGADVVVMACAPDGRNINEGCGSTHLEALVERVVAEDFDAGFAFDGDGDRVLAVDRRGAVVDGDELIALAAMHLRRAGALPGDGVAVTVMTNYGFHQAMDAVGVRVATTPVGDRHVLSELIARGWALGGEQSGHIIDTNFVPSGDGIAAALLTLEALAGRDLADRDAMTKLPQRLVNVRVADSSGLDSAAGVQEAVERESRGLEGRGRVLVRPSGTEPLVRVMVEAPDGDECDEVAGRLVEVVERALGQAARGS
jgi:phosphoglucosamine mutase